MVERDGGGKRRIKQAWRESHMEGRRLMQRWHSFNQKHWGLGGRTDGLMWRNGWRGEVMQGWSEMTWSLYDKWNHTGLPPRSDGNGLDHGLEKYGGQKKPKT